jgi:uncharacterized phage-associated protein
MKADQKVPEGILPNIITYFCFKANPLSLTKLTKLVYLTEVYYYQAFGSRLTEVPFIHYFHGPWASDIELTLEKLYEDEIVEEKVVTTKAGYRAVIPKPKIREAVITLPNDIFQVLEEVTDDWGSASPEEVVNFTKTTLPFLNTSFFQKIDFSRTDPIKEYAKEKGISEKRAATMDIIYDKTLKDSLLKSMEDVQKGHFLPEPQVFGND